MDPAHNGTGTSFGHTNLTVETAYHYRVRAWHDDVADEWSGTASATTQATPNRLTTGKPAIMGTA